jgi:hypothetical protein
MCVHNAESTMSCANKAEVVTDKNINCAILLSHCHISNVIFNHGTAVIGQVIYNRVT